jgi:Na+/alanine symporter
MLNKFNYKNTIFQMMVLFLLSLITVYIFLAGFLVRLEVCRKIVPHMAAIFLTYAVTLALFPGIGTYR